jgi:hypothetical protein
MASGYFGPFASPAAKGLLPSERAVLSQLAELERSRASAFNVSSRRVRRRARAASVAGGLGRALRGAALSLFLRPRKA